MIPVSVCLVWPEIRKTDFIPLLPHFLFQSISLPEYLPNLLTFPISFSTTNIQATAPAGWTAEKSPPCSNSPPGSILPAHPSAQVILQSSAWNPSGPSHCSCHEKCDLPPAHKFPCSQVPSLPLRAVLYPLGLSFLFLE